MSARISDVRRSLAFTGLLSLTEEAPFMSLRTLVSSLHQTSHTYAWINTVQGVTLTNAAKQDPQTYRAIIFVGINLFHQQYCVGGRLGRG
jgi:hypothetical protein